MEITGIRPDEYAEATRIWEASVRATHDFVTEADLDVFRPLVAASFGQLEHLAGLRDDDGRLLGFAGATAGKLEMLFLAPEARGRGGGTLLLDHARRVFGVTAVDVNEQNPQAVGFYLHHGFTVSGRSERDGTGKPYPLLHLTI
ncbi:GNAT family N-acetyltransferase [Kribbella sp. CA-253562]|uniref:GNAT family N-acetyltransferase n=1 Tax=Kribbella sp. CA-253562 TaxID=3239942 RepID=UPI003D8C5A53